MVVECHSSYKYQGSDDIKADVGEGNTFVFMNFQISWFYRLNSLIVNFQGN